MNKTCPYCGAQVPGDDPWAEIDHMTYSHPEIIRERLRSIGATFESIEMCEHQRIRAECMICTRVELTRAYRTINRVEGFLTANGIAITAPIDEALENLVQKVQQEYAQELETLIGGSGDPWEAAAQWEAAARGHVETIDLLRHQMAELEEELEGLNVALDTGRRAENEWIHQYDLAKRPASWSRRLLERDEVQGRKVLERMIEYYVEHDGRANDFGRLNIVIDAQEALEETKEK